MKRTYTIHHLNDQKFRYASDPSKYSWPQDYITDVAKITIEVEQYIKDPAYYLIDIFRLAQNKDSYWADNFGVSSVKPKLGSEYIGSPKNNKWRSLTIGDVISDEDGNVHKVVAGDFVPLLLKGKLVG